VAIVKYEIEIPDDIELSEIHELHFNVISDAIKLFVKKNHDYSSSWRLYDVNSIVRELSTRIVRILKLLELEKKGKSSKVNEGISSEFIDMINWCVFAILVRDGHGIDLINILDCINLPIKNNEDINYILPKEVEVVDEISKDNIQVELDKLIEERLASDNPFPVSIIIDADNPISSIERFNLGNGPFYYVRSDFVHKELTDQVKKEYPNKVVFLKMSDANNSIPNIDHINDMNNMINKEDNNYMGNNIDNINKLLGLINL
jgi:hypothetical protein